MNGKFLNSLLAGAALAGATAFSDLEAAPVKQNTKITSTVKANNTLKANDGWNVPLSDFMDEAISFIKKWEGKVVDNAGNHVLYDDDTSKTVKPRWDGKGGKKGIERFIKSCKGKPTIGYGETDPRRVRLGKISDEQATSWLSNRIVSIYNKLTDQFTINGSTRLSNYPGKAGMFTLLSPNQKIALISFHYNLGSGFMKYKTQKMRTAFQAGDWDNVRYEMRDCINSNGKPVEGLRNRRKAEMELWNTPWN